VYPHNDINCEVLKSTQTLYIYTIIYNFILVFILMKTFGATYSVKVIDKLLCYPFKVAYTDHAIPPLTLNRKHLICEITFRPNSLA